MSVIAGKSQTSGSSCNLPKEILDYGKAGKQTAGQRTRLTLGSFACLDYRVQGDGPSARVLNHFPCLEWRFGEAPAATLVTSGARPL